MWFPACAPDMQDAVAYVLARLHSYQDHSAVDPVLQVPNGEILSGRVTGQSVEDELHVRGLELDSSGVWRQLLEFLLGDAQLWLHPRMQFVQVLEGRSPILAKLTSHKVQVPALDSRNCQRGNPNEDYEHSKEHCQKQEESAALQVDPHVRPESGAQEDVDNALACHPVQKSNVLAHPSFQVRHCQHLRKERCVEDAENSSKEEEVDHLKCVNPL
mmetsp:Transcript_67302/g.119900  ORF Transcript_67302/g.119900 Transcript_67302/m.119900 type:complete len:215 (-) Transcript_67302:406-1050(-)